MNAMPVRRLANVALLAVGIGGMLLFVVGASRSDRPTGPRWPTYLEEVATAEEAFALLGQQAFVLRLVGGPARC